MQELLRACAAHEPVVGLHDDVLESEAREDALVGVALRLVRDLETGVGVVERVGVFHRELAAAQQSGAGAGLVAVLVLDLVDRQRQVFVRVVEVLHEQREDLLVRRGEQVVGALAVLQTEDAVAVLLPPAALLVGFARQQRGEQHLLCSRGFHLVADDGLDLASHLESERQPGEDPRRLTTDVAGADQEPMRGHLGVGGVFAQGADEELGEAR